MYSSTQHLFIPVSGTQLEHTHTQLQARMVVAEKLLLLSTTDQQSRVQPPKVKSEHVEAGGDVQNVCSISSSTTDPPQSCHSRSRSPRKTTAKTREGTKGFLNVHYIFFLNNPPSSLITQKSLVCTLSQELMTS